MMDGALKMRPKGTSMKYLNRFYIREDMLDEYVRRHDQIWKEMRELILEAGLENYTLWSTGPEIFEYFETADLLKAQAIIGASEVKKKWDRYMEDIIRRDGWRKTQSLTLVFDIERGTR